MYNDKRNKEDRPIWLTSLAEADCDTLPATSIDDRLQGALRRRRQRILSQRVGGVVLAAGLAFGFWQISTTRSTSYTEIADDNVADAITEAMTDSATAESAPEAATEFASEPEAAEPEAAQSAAAEAPETHPEPVPQSEEK